MIGIAITTKNRRENALKCIKEWEKLLPKNSKLVIVDDNSEIPFPNCTYRFNRNAGIASAKNKCIELLEGCEHIFLVDDDVYPISKNWYLPYINSKQPHFCFTFQTGSTQISKTKLIDGELLVSNNSVRGCVLYYHKSVFEKVGGFKNDFIGYGWEHIELTNRIFNAGLIPERYLDVPNSDSLFYSLDQKRETESSVPLEERYFDLNNKLLLYKNYNKFEYVYYKEMELSPVILTAYFTLQKDPQRELNWSKGAEGLSALIESCINLRVKLVVFYDSINQDFIDLNESALIQFIRIKPFKEYSTNVYRRIVFYEYLKLKHHPKVFMVDSTDVEVLKYPFDLIKEGVLYVGDEMKVLKNKWIIEQFERASIDYDDIMDKYGDNQLLNAGIIGGSYDIALEFLAKNTDIHTKYSRGVEKSTDMAVFNYVVFSFFNERYEHGDHINTPFKFNKYTDAIFKHK
jgi:glycosyltransferase involved in cell wall biosynthesis